MSLHLIRVSRVWFSPFLIWATLILARAALSRNWLKMVKIPLNGFKGKPGHYTNTLPSSSTYRNSETTPVTWFKSTIDARLALLAAEYVNFGLSSPFKGCLIFIRRCWLSSESRCSLSVLWSLTEARIWLNFWVCRVIDGSGISMLNGFIIVLFG